MTDPPFSSFFDTWKQNLVFSQQKFEYCNDHNNMGLKNQKHLRRSAIAKKQHSNSSRRFENFDVTIESSVQSLSPSLL